MQQKSFVTQGPTRECGRLNLVPRLRADETLSSWLERFAGAYGMKVRDFTQWLGYRALHSVHGGLRLDLDICAPADLAPLLAKLTAHSAQTIETHRMTALGRLPPHLRRAFCSQCWAEEGSYRRREWASAWSLVCTRHHRLLLEKPLPQPPFERDYEESWLEFYKTPACWRESGPSWQSERWGTICAALGVEPRSEFLRAWRWLRDLQDTAATARHVPLTDSVISGMEIRHCAAVVEKPVNPELTRVGSMHETTRELWRVKRDLVLYALVKFHDRSLLQSLDEAISVTRLIQDRTTGEVCTLVTPEADYSLRLFAAVVAMHLWERLVQGQWRCGHYQKLETILARGQRWNDEDWWLERRLRTWPVCFQGISRELFNKKDPWVLQPPWERCRHSCLLHVSGTVHAGLSVQLPRDWHCQFGKSSHED